MYQPIHFFGQQIVDGTSHACWHIGGRCESTWHFTTRQCHHALNRAWLVLIVAMVCINSDMNDRACICLCLILLVSCTHYIILNFVFLLMSDIDRCHACRLTNIGNNSISLDDVTFDYWFNGPAEGDQQFSTDLFRPICGESTISKRPVDQSKICTSIVREPVTACSTSCQN